MGNKYIKMLGILGEEVAKGGVIGAAGGVGAGLLGAITTKNLSRIVTRKSPTLVLTADELKMLNPLHKALAITGGALGVARGAARGIERIRQSPFEAVARTESKLKKYIMPIVAGAAGLTGGRLGYLASRKND